MREIRNYVSWGQWLPTLRRLPHGINGVALSFDDGPTPATTPCILDLLARYRAPATFFLAGERASREPALVRAIVGRGHAVFGHGWSHIRLDQAGPERLVAEVGRAEALLSRFRPTPSPYLVRLPYASGRRTAWVHRALRSWRRDCRIVHWSLSLDDHTIALCCREQGDLAERCRRAVAEALQRPDLARRIVLLHESPFDVESPLNPLVAPLLLEALLEGLAARRMPVVPLHGPRTSSPLARFILL